VGDSKGVNALGENQNTTKKYKAPFLYKAMLTLIPKFLSYDPQKLS